MHDQLRLHRAQNAADDLNIDSDNDTSEFIFAGGPVRIKRVSLVVTTAVVNAADTVEVELYRYPVAGSSSNAVLLGTWLITGTTTRAAGAYCFKDCHVDDADGETAEDGSLRFEAPDSNTTAAVTGYSVWDIPAGSSFAMKVVEAADSGVVIPAVEFVLLPLAGAYLDRTNVFQDVSDVM